MNGEFDKTFFILFLLEYIYRYILFSFPRIKAETAFCKYILTVYNIKKSILKHCCMIRFSISELSFYFYNTVMLFMYA